ncbi:MAG: hypothetical protein HND55_12055 [Pseudomonadota bacterium]|nr:MAG: hypothetical protein HND55_12055 [Pseudomonadota bacterium]
MTESNREYLSCLMDGELDRSARRFLLRRLADDAEMKATWQRFHLVRACLHQENFATADLSERVSSALDGEALEASPGRSGRWLRPVAGSVIAASVALMAIVGINSTMLEQEADRSTQSGPGFVSQPTSLDRSFNQSAVPVSYSEQPADVRQRIGGYVLRHHQAAGGAGFVAYVPLVTEMAEAGANDNDVAEESPVDAVESR